MPLKITIQGVLVNPKDPEACDEALTDILNDYNRYSANARQWAQGVYLGTSNRTVHSGNRKLKLAIISHTEHYLKDGKFVGWGPTVAEINHLAGMFEEIWHIAVLYEGDPPSERFTIQNGPDTFCPPESFRGARGLMTNWVCCLPRLQ